MVDAQAVQLQGRQREGTRTHLPEAERALSRDGGLQHPNPTTGGVRELRRFGFAAKTEADKAATQVWDLIRLAGADKGTQQRIGDLIFQATARGGQLPAVAEVRRRLGLGLDPAQPGVTVAAWLDSWLAGKRRTKRASTVRGYESHCRVHVNPVIGDLPLERLNAGHVEALLAAVPGSAGTRHRVLATLRAGLNAAVKQRQITWNPCAGIELEPENPAEAQRWTPAEAARFLGYVADDPMGLKVRMREVGHAGRDINDRYTHVLIEAHLAAAEQTAALIREAGKTAP